MWQALQVRIGPVSGNERPSPAFRRGPACGRLADDGLFVLAGRARHAHLEAAHSVCARRRPSWATGRTHGAQPAHPGHQDDRLRLGHDRHRSVRGPDWSAVRSRGRRRGHLLLIAETEGDAELERGLIHEDVDRQVDGLSTRRCSRARRAAGRGSGRTASCSSTPRPATERAGRHTGRARGRARAAAQVLLEAGHRDGIHLVGEFPEHEIFAGARARRRDPRPLRRRGPGAREHRRMRNGAPAPACAAVRDLPRRRAARPRAFIAMNDRAAFGHCQALLDAGLRVRRDVSLVSFDDSDLATGSRPDSTSLALPHEVMGRAAVELLLAAPSRGSCVASRCRCAHASRSPRRRPPESGVARLARPQLRRRRLEHRHRGRGAARDTLRLERLEGGAVADVVTGALSDRSQRTSRRSQKAWTGSALWPGTRFDHGEPGSEHLRAPRSAVAALGPPRRLGIGVEVGEQDPCLSLARRHAGALAELLGVVVAACDADVHAQAVAADRVSCRGGPRRRVAEVVEAIEMAAIASARRARRRGRGGVPPTAPRRSGDGCRPRRGTPRCRRRRRPGWRCPRVRRRRSRRGSGGRGGAGRRDRPGGSRMSRRRRGAPRSGWPARTNSVFASEQSPQNTPPRCSPRADPRSARAVDAGGLRVGSRMNSRRNCQERARKRVTSRPSSSSPRRRSGGPHRRQPLASSVRSTSYSRFTMRSGASLIASSDRRPRRSGRGVGWGRRERRGTGR